MLNKKIFFKDAIRRLKDIHRLSARFNKLVNFPHQKRLLELMRHHIDEIEELACSGDKHFLVETGDLAVLCLELLLEHRRAPDAVLEQCFGRYERKLTELISAAKVERKSRHKRKKDRRV